MSRVVIVAFGWAAAQCVGAQVPVGFADPVLGRWDLTVTDGDDSWPSWLEVRLRTEAELMGRFVGRFGSVRHISEISWIDAGLSFTVPLQYERGDRPLDFTGALADGVLEGTLVDANGRTLSWSGERAPQLVRTAASAAGAAIDLFNGRDLAGWRARFGNAADCWRVDAGLLSLTPPCVDLVSERHFEDFELRLEFRIPQGSNSGVYLRGRYEVQIQDTAGQALDALRMAAVYGFIAPTHDAAGAPGQWQTLEIRLIGREISVTLNGSTVIDAERIPGITGGALDSNEGAPGPIMIQGDHAPITIRSVRLTPLTAR